MTEMLDNITTFPLSFSPRVCTGLAGGELGGSTVIRPQRQRLWCWASVAEFVHGVFGKSRSQGEIATFEGFDCEPGRRGHVASVCNRTECLDVVLAGEGLLAGKPTLSFDWSLLTEQIAAGSPVAFRVRSGNAGHFGAVSGWASCEGDRFVEVMDPAGGFIRYLRESTLRSDYPGWGRLTHLLPTAPRERREIPCQVGQTGASWGLPSLKDLSILPGLSRLSLMGGWEDRLRRSLRTFFAMAGRSPRPLRGVDPEDLRVTGPIAMTDIVSQIEDPDLHHVQETTCGFFLESGGRDLGVIELSWSSKRGWRFESLSSAPGKGGDRFAAAIREVLGRATADRLRNAVVVRVPHLYETALIEVDDDDSFPPERDARVYPFRPDFSFEAKRLDDTMPWGKYQEHLAEVEDETRERLLPAG